MKDNKLTFIDFFAGIGGFRSGLEKTGHFKCIGYVEIDKFARQSYQLLYDTKDEWTAEDVTKVKGENIPKADMWTFGFPCQDISIAGKQKGMHTDTRSGLFYEIMRCLDECKENKPQWLIVENVRNLLSIEKGRTFGRVLLEMAHRGYGIKWRVFNSKDYGVPQNRERVYLIGYLGGAGRREVLPKTPSSNPNSISITSLIRDLERTRQRNRVVDPKGISPCLLAASNDSKIKIIMKAKIPKKGQRGVVRDVKGLASTLMSSDHKGAQLIYGKDYRIRYLTPREYWRLQGFTDQQFNKVRPHLSDSQLYKQAGNSVTVNVVEYIGNAIYKSINQKGE